MTNSTDAELTELEGLLLAKVARFAPITAYELKQSVAAAPSRFWSGSAGAIYPAVKRLHARGYLAPKNATVGRRKAVAYELTRHGKQAFLGWICDLERAIDPGVDPLRMRMLFLDLIPSQKRKTFLTRVKSELEKQTTEAPFAPPKTSAENKAHQLWMKARKSGFEAVIKLHEKITR